MYSSGETILSDELAAFYERSGFGPVVGKRQKTVRVYTGCLLVPLPNIETRSRYLKYHDLHHLMTGYSVGRLGEGEVSAWELGTGSMLVSPTLGFMNLIALSTGLVLKPRRMWRAFRKGCASRNLYRAAVRQAVDRGEWQNVATLKKAFVSGKVEPAVAPLRVAEFSLYALAALLIHALIAIPAVVARFVTDITLGYSFFQAVKPVPRTDLY
jgi:hypothetical protein